MHAAKSMDGSADGANIRKRTINMIKLSVISFEYSVELRVFGVGVDAGAIAKMYAYEMSIWNSIDNLFWLGWLQTKKFMLVDHVFILLYEFPAASMPFSIEIMENWWLRKWLEKYII